MCVGIVRLRAGAESVSNATHVKPSLRELLVAVYFRNGSSLRYLGGLVCAVADSRVCVC